MDVSHRSEETLPEAGARRPRGSSAPRSQGTLSSRRVGELLGGWQRREVQIARAFRECRGLSREQLEDIYQETAVALLGRSYSSEEHLRNALRTGLKHRALNLHRDQRRREQILAQNALRLVQDAGRADGGSDRSVLIREDRLLASEFLTELTAIEQRVFWLLAEGTGYRAIAPTLGVAVNEARNAARSCERKRERFQLLYDTGRLCGFRSVTIKALMRGEATSDKLAQRAFVHLEGCASCRAEHRTNAKRLRRSFQEQIAALLPVPALLGHGAWLARGQARLGSVQHRLRAEALPFGGGGMSGRTVALLGGSGAAAKLAVGAATVAVIAGSTITASTVVEAPRTHHQVPHSARRVSAPRRSAVAAPAYSEASAVSPPPSTSAPRAEASPAARPEFGPGRVVALPTTVPRAAAGGAKSELARAAPANSEAAAGGSSESSRAGAAGRGGPFSP
jgi:DNA-directed RNA polymerase specialized sigma24 family protein